MNKGLTITLIVLLLTLVISLIVGLTIFIKKGISFTSFSINNVSKNLVEEKEINNIKDLFIDFNTCDVEVKTTTEELIKVQIYSDYEDSHKIEEQEDIINIVFREKKGSHFFKKTSKIYIYVPETYNKNITIDGNVGDIHIPELVDSNIKAELSVGDIHIDNVNEADIKVSTGDIKIEKVTNLIAKLQTGDIKVEKVYNYINIDARVGDVKIEEVELYEDSKIELKTGDVKIQRTNEIYIDADTRIGDTKVKNNDRKAEHELTIKVDVGDIKVN